MKSLKRELKEGLESTERSTAKIFFACALVVLTAWCGTESARAANEENGDKENGDEPNWFLQLAADSACERAAGPEETDCSMQSSLYVNYASGLAVTRNRGLLTFLVEGRFSDPARLFPIGSSGGVSIHFNDSFGLFRPEFVPSGASIGLGLSLDDTNDGGTILAAYFRAGYRSDLTDSKPFYDVGFLASRERRVEKPSAYRTDVELYVNGTAPLDAEAGQLYVDIGASYLRTHSRDEDSDPYAFVAHIGAEPETSAPWTMRAQIAVAAVSDPSGDAYDTIRRIDLSLLYRLPFEREEMIDPDLKPGVPSSFYRTSFRNTSIPSSFYRTSFRNTNRGSRWLTH